MTRLASHLNEMAAQHGIAVVVTNQMLVYFDGNGSSSSSSDGSKQLVAALGA